MRSGKRGETEARGPASGQRLQRDQLIDNSIFALAEAAPVDGLKPPYGEPNVVRNVGCLSEGDNVVVDGSDIGCIPCRELVFRPQTSPGMPLARLKPRPVRSNLAARSVKIAPIETSPGAKSQRARSRSSARPGPVAESPRGWLCPGSSPSRTRPKERARSPRDLRSNLGLGARNATPSSPAAPRSLRMSGA